MRPILTLTMNPALDVSTSVEHVVAQHKMRCAPPSYDPGGGGINVARVVRRLSGETLAVVLLGGPSGEMLRRLLDAEGVPSRAIATGGVTRESFSALETATGRQFRFVLPGPAVGETEWQQAIELMAALAPQASCVVASGSLPPGLPEDFYARLAARLADVGGCLVLDSSGPALKAGLGRGIRLIKPSERELSELAGRELDWPQGHADFARELIARGGAQAVVVSAGPEGALLVTAEAQELLRPLKVEVNSAIGAGDSFVAGICLGLAWEWPLLRACRYGMAAAAATLLTPGTELCRPEDVARLFAEIEARDGGR